jgi:hypothetical protein
VSKQSKQASKKAKQASNQPSKSKQRKPIAQQPKQATSQCYPASKKQKNKLIRPAKNQAQTEALSLFRVCCLRSKSLLDNQVKQAKGNQQITSGDLPNNYQ